MSHPAILADFPDGRRKLVSILHLSEKERAEVYAELLAQGAKLTDLDLDEEDRKRGIQRDPDGNVTRTN